jgi:hypothetical protein
MGFIRELGAAAILIPVLLAVFLAVGVIFFLTMLLKNVPAFRKLRKGVLIVGALLATAAVSVGLTYYLTRLAFEDKGAVEGLKISRQTIDEKTATIEEQKKTIAEMKTRLDAAAVREAASGDQLRQTLKTRDDDLASARKRIADLEKTLARRDVDIAQSRAALDSTLRFVSKEQMAPLVYANGKLSDNDVRSLADFQLTLVKPTLRSSRLEAVCPMKYVTTGSTFALKAGKESFTPDKIDFDAAKWRVTLTFYSAATAEDAMRFTHTNDLTLTADNKANPCHVAATFTKSATADGWLSSTTGFDLTNLEIGPTRISKTKDGWRAETDTTAKPGVFTGFMKYLWDKF